MKNERKNRREKNRNSKIFDINQCCIEENKLGRERIRKQKRKEKKKEDKEEKITKQIQNY